MNSYVLVTVLVVLVIVVFIFARQIIQRPVTQLSLLMPLILSVAFGGLFLAGHPTPEGIIAVNAALIAALVGNFVGRDIRTALRALPLAGGSFTNLASR